MITTRTAKAESGDVETERRIHKVMQKMKNYKQNL
jgi:hypothetical protein